MLAPVKRMGRPVAGTPRHAPRCVAVMVQRDRKSTRLNSSHSSISYAVFCLKKKKRGGKSLLPLLRPAQTHPVLGITRRRLPTAPRYAQYDPLPYHALLPHATCLLRSECVLP